MTRPQADPCTCPHGFPRLLQFDEDGPVTVVRDHDCCLLDSVRASGVHLPAPVFEDRVADAVGEKQAAAMEERRRG